MNDEEYKPSNLLLENNHYYLKWFSQDIMADGPDECWHKDIYIDGIQAYTIEARVDLPSIFFDDSKETTTFVCYLKKINTEICLTRIIFELKTNEQISEIHNEFAEIWKALDIPKEGKNLIND